MLLLLCILLSTAGDEFTCKSNELQEAMPLLKQIVSHQCYSSLEKIVASSKKQSNVPADALGKMVMDCASNEEERALCCAVIRVKHGYYSITDPFISRFAQLDESQESRIRAFNTVCLDAVNATVKDITDHSSREAFVKAWIRAQSIYQKNYETGIASILNEDQRARLNKVYVKYDHASAVQRLLTKRLSERSTIGPLQLGNQQTHHPNIQMHFSAGYLILLDNKAARDHLHLTPAQLEAVVELYEQYASAVDELQLSLSQTYSKSTPETYHT
ncbi:MAG TPA: hypothetical protein PLX97_03345, partial [Gemmatales bacterium]|nr:hypothetical protein [Gemmatales bacterium]